LLSLSLELSLSDFFKDEEYAPEYILTVKQKELIKLARQLKDEEIDYIIERIKIKSL
jgi:hypothetical protein